MRSWPFVATLLVAGLLTGCTGDGAQEAPSPTPQPSVSSPSATSADELPFDCDAVAAAQQALGDAATAELERLGIDRSAPEAFTVVLLATSQGAAEYWAAIAGSTLPGASDELRSDIQAVADYWDGIDEQLAAIKVADSSAAAVQAAGAELVTVGQSQPNEALAPAQQRVQDELGATCGVEPQAPSASP